MMEAVSTTETTVNIYEATRFNNTEDSHFVRAAVRTENLSVADVNICN
jgi:hypothetical protein